MMISKKVSYLEALSENISKSELDAAGYSIAWPYFDSIKKEGAADYLSYFKAIVKQHMDPDQGSKFWIERTKNRGITGAAVDAIDSLADLVDALGYSDQTLLNSHEGYEDFYKPAALKNGQYLYESSSSGTTGKPKRIMIAETALKCSAINEAVGILNQSEPDSLEGLLIALGPLGAYQREHEILSGFLGLQYKNLGFETAGLKLKSKEELMQILGPIMSEFSMLASKNKVGLSTGTPDITNGQNHVMYKNINNFKFSGTTITYDTIDNLSKETSKNIIPSYGHFAAMSSIGFKNDGKLTYFPSEPFTKFIVTDENGKEVDYGGRGKVVIIIARPELLYIESTDYGTRSLSNAAFKGIDGVADISRQK